MSVASRKAAIGDKLVTTVFDNAVTHGLSAADDCKTAICCLPGTEIAFDENVKIAVPGYLLWGTDKEVPHKVAIFRQLNKEHQHVHHDALEFPDGSTALIHDLVPGQTATVLQLPAEPRTEKEAEDQRRLEVVG
jgi:hypothetical protein